MAHEQDNTGSGSLRTEPRGAGDKVSAVIQASKDLDQKIQRLNTDLSSVHKTSRLLTGPMDLSQVLQIVLETVSHAVGADAAGIRLLDEETGELVLKATYGLSDAYKNKGPVTAAESSLNQKALQGEAIIVSDMRTDPRFENWREEIVREGLISTLYIGLMYRDKGIGIFRLYSKKPRGFSPQDIALAQTVAAQSAAAITNARLYEEALEKERMARQIKLAGTVQRHLIPQKAPKLPGFDLSGQYVPCYDVGGDFYDFIPMADGTLVITIGDVMGKGVPASLTMAALRSSLRAYAEQIHTIDEIARRANRMFCHDTEMWEFATLFCAHLDPRNSRLSYCNCGHEPPLLIRGGETLSLQEGGMVLGIQPENDYESRHITLEEGDLLVFYTDGLADAVNFERESFGRKRIIEAARNSRDMSAEQAAKNILWLMRKFSGLTPRRDDTAIVVLKKSSGDHPARAPVDYMHLYS